MDETTFSDLIARHRRELHLHCYRMLGSFDEAEDALQEALARAWRSRHSCHTAFRAWLYRIATNTCLVLRERRNRQPLPAGSPVDLPLAPWLQPYPDQLLDETPPQAAVTRETVELVFLAAIQHLPPRQRAVLILRDVLGWPAQETADVLDSSVAAVKSALQRARATVRQVLPPQRNAWQTTTPTGQDRAALHRYLAAHERGDQAAFAALLCDDVRMSMPPEPGWYHGRTTVVQLWSSVMVGPTAWGRWRAVVTGANRHPAIAWYLRRGHDHTYRAQNLDVLTMRNGKIAQIIGFDATVFPRFGLPEHAAATD